MKKIVYYLLFMFSVLTLHAQNVSYNEAYKVAQNFLNTSSKNINECSYISQDEEDIFFYIFSTSDAYVVVSAEKSCPPILAFSKEHSFDAQQIIEPVKMWLTNYEQQIKQAKQLQVLPSATIEKAWDNLLNNKQIRNQNFVDPFLLSKWGQEKKYNYYCPKITNGPNGRAVTGCVATAMAQLMYYFRFPDTGMGSYSYEDETLGTLSANFGETTYNYASMADEPTAINLAISTLMYHCGVSVDMVYGANGSGMYNHKAAYSLRTYFKYSPETAYLFRDSTNLNWDSIMVNHLQRRIPLYYAGWSEPNIMGHAFICDGYSLEESGYYYHFNFGWDGSYDGYFYTEDLVVGGNNFKLAQELIINAYPDTLHYTYPQPNITGETILTNESGSFEDGSSPCENYAHNVDYSWIINPDYDSIKKIQLTIHYDIAANDTLFVLFNNDSMEDQIITNDSSDYSCNYSGHPITIRFKTNNEISKQGFSASYTTTFPFYCNGIVITDENGSFEDGSGDLSYNNFTNCMFLLYVASANQLTLDFTRFETEAEKDVLNIYDRTNGYDLLETLSGTLEQTHFTFNTNVIALEFITDELHTFDGWEVQYSSSNTAIDECNDINDEIVIYPNPTTHLLDISSLPSNVETITIFDVTGKTVSTIDPSHSTSNIDVNHL
ncbi:MAG: C10 family peptidase, partial [Bacteroidales bacterium]|nr:C10 family peptidase [Bacteroidales bacterium]